MVLEGMGTPNPQGNGVTWKQFWKMGLKLARDCDIMWRKRDGVMNRHYKYYNQQEELSYEQLNLIEGKKKFNLETKQQIQNYFRSRTYISGLLTAREYEVFSRFFGLNGEFMQPADIARELNISRQYTGYALYNACEKLGNSRNRALVANLIDAEIDLNAEKTVARADIDAAYHTKMANTEKRRRDKLTSIQEEAERVCERILAKDAVAELGLSNTEAGRALCRCIGDGKKPSFENVLQIPVGLLVNNDLYEIEETIHNLGLHFTFEAEYQQDWERMCRNGVLAVGLDKLKERFGIRSALTEKKMAKFNELIGMPIQELNLSTRAYNCMRRAQFYRVSDVIVHTEEELARIRNAGEKVLAEVQDAVYGLGLDLRPESKSVDEWLGELQRKFLAKSAASNTKANWLDSGFDINEIPEKYRKAYAVGAGVLAREDIKKADGLISRLAHRYLLEDNEAINVRSDRGGLKSSAKIEIGQPLDAKNMADMTDEQILKCIGDDLSIIEDLDSEFISRYNKELIKIVIQNSNSVRVDYGLHLLDILYDANNALNA